MNYIFIPMDPAHGYVIAAYTTLVGYVLLFIFHVFIVKKLNMLHVYDLKFNIMVLSAVLVVSLAMNLLYGISPFIRYAIALIYGAGLLFFVFRNRKTIIGLLRK